MRSTQYGGPSEHGAKADKGLIEESRKEWNEEAKKKTAEQEKDAHKSEQQTVPPTAFMDGEAAKEGPVTKDESYSWQRGPYAEPSSADGH